MKTQEAAQAAKPGGTATNIDRPGVMGTVTLIHQIKVTVPITPGRFSYLE